MIECEIKIINKLGLHARAAAKLASTAGRYAAAIQTGHSLEKLVDAKSVMSLMLLAASQDTVLHFRFNGEDEDAAHDNICQLIADRFGESE
ncbi:MAG: HPr family phosphocarrier protein [Porticoccaceae bacterium]|nr:HPr family phosphocarrier protein [Pseudomonadales bacterium]MCP5172606.1 HPr family phosphocarrier protein [Pseudomonadales bacterium]MCP5303522.1 HPr family phosphocarrier protein [Pseudomonadales bacterium]